MQKQVDASPFIGSIRKGLVLIQPTEQPPLASATGFKPLTPPLPDISLVSADQGNDDPGVRYMPAAARGLKLYGNH